MRSRLKNSRRLQAFRQWYFRAPTTDRQATTYMAMIGIFYPIVFIAAFLFADAGLMTCWATALLDVLLHVRNQVRTRLPMSIPLGLVGVAGIMLSWAVGWPRWGGV